LRGRRERQELEKRVRQGESGGRDNAASRSTASHGRLGSFDFDSAGRLRPNLPAARLGMEFRWRGRPVTTSVRAIGDGQTGTMLFRTQAGRMPSSAIAAPARPDAFELARCLSALLPPSWTLTVGADHSLQLAAEMQIVMPALVSDLLVPAVQFCLAASPYLDLLEENAMGMRA
jgi:hypothetical protein